MMLSTLVNEAFDGRSLGVFDILGVGELCYTKDGYFCLFLVWWLNVWSVVTSTSRWKFEAIDGKWKISIIWIIDEESVVN